VEFVEYEEDCAEGVDLFNCYSRWTIHIDDAFVVCKEVFGSRPCQMILNDILGADELDNGEFDDDP
jgi:hypothetical protein